MRGERANFDLFGNLSAIVIPFQNRLLLNSYLSRISNTFSN